MASLLLLLLATAARADPPATSYIFPAGAQRGTTVECRVGGLNLSAECGFRMVATGVEAATEIKSIPTIVLTGPQHHNPIAQQAWDYPKDMAAAIKIAPDAPPGVIYWYCTTSEGATPLRPFVVGDLPEVIEEEQKTTTGRPQAVTLPVTINGRVYPRADLDEFSFEAKAGEHVSCEVTSQRLGHKLDANLELRDAAGRTVASADDAAGRDPLLLTTLPADGSYVLRIHDIAFEGDQDYVYRLTLRTGPRVTHVFPAGGRRGDRTQLRLYGSGFGAGNWLDQVVIAGGQPPPWQADSLGFDFQLGDLPEVIEVEPNESGQQGRRIALPAVLNGQILTAGDTDEFVFTAAGGQKLDFDFYGRRLGSPISAVWTLSDSQGKQLARQEGDTRLSWVAPADGDFTLRVQELHHETHGGSEYVYRLIARPTEPDFRLTLERDNVGVLPGQTPKLKMNVQRLGGFQGEIQLVATELPTGVALAPNVIAANQNQVELSITAAKDAPIGDTRRSVIIGAGVVAGERMLRTAEVPVAGSGRGQTLDSLAVTVVHPPLFAIHTEEVYGFANRGATCVQKFTINRQADFHGPIELRLADRQARYLQGATGPVIVVQPDQTEVDYPVFFPETMDLNRTARVLLMGTAKVTEPSGRVHYVTHTTQKQIVARVSPSIMTLAAERDFVEVAPGQTVEVPLQLGRLPALTGPVAIEAIVPPEMSGISVAPAAADEGQEVVRMMLAAGAEIRLGDHDHIRFRATASRDGHPVIAETAVGILPAPGHSAAR